MNKYTYVCATCGSEDVRSDAWASWNKLTQQWELSSVFDNCYCNKCEGECRIETHPLEGGDQ